MEENIMNAFEFSREDLQANENGFLSKTQEDILCKYVNSQSCWGRAAFFAFGLSFVIMFGVFLLEAKPGSPEFRESIPYFAGTCAAFLLISVFFAYLGRVRSRDLRSGSISTIEGEIRTWTKEFDIGTAFYIKLGGTRFQLHSKEQMDALSNSSFYRVHFVRNPPAHVILSIKVLG